LSLFDLLNDPVVDITPFDASLLLRECRQFLPVAACLTADATLRDLPMANGNHHIGIRIVQIVFAVNRKKSRFEIGGVPF
jgi:hypothetical protein